MTLEGTANKTLLLLGLLVSSAAWVWFQAGAEAVIDPMLASSQVVAATSTGVVPWMIGGGVIGLILGLVITFKAHLAQYLAPAYAICQGLMVGGMSVMFERAYPGIAFQASALTFGTLFALLGAYKAGWIKVTDKLRSGIVMAMGGIMVTYLVAMVAGMFGVNLSMIHGSGPISIGFSLVVVAVAAMSLLLDFEFIAEGSRSGAPKYMEWYGAFSLMVTLIWLYMEILKLLSKLNRRD
jgi:uncharacterized YccA/Bax inhibitor family protein